LVDGPRAHGNRHLRAATASDWRIAPAGFYVQRMRRTSQNGARLHALGPDSRYEFVAEEPLSYTIRRAVDIIATQLRCDDRVALETLESLAAATGQAVEDVAVLVLEGAVRFES